MIRENEKRKKKKKLTSQLTANGSALGLKRVSVEFKIPEIPDAISRMGSGDSHTASGSTIGIVTPMSSSSYTGLKGPVPSVLELK